MNIGKVLIVDPLHRDALDLLERDGRFRVVVVPPEDEAVQRELADTHAITLRNFRFTAAHVERARELRLVSRHGVGFDTVDVAALTGRGIPLALALGANAISVAEHAFALLLGLVKQIAPYDAAVRTADYAKRGKFAISEIYEKKLLLVGLGRIGLEMARRATGFGMKVAAFDPAVTADRFAGAGVELVSDLDAALAEADVISLHVPLTDATRGLISAERIARMKPGTILLNCARPGLIDENALADAIGAGKLGGAGIDTFDQSVVLPDTHVFNTSSRMLRSPYVAALAEESVRRTSLMTVGAIIAARDGKLDRGLLANPEVLAQN